MKDLFDRLTPWLAEPDGDLEPEGGGWRTSRVFRIAVRTAVLIATFVVLNRATAGACNLPEAAQGWSILESCLELRSLLLVSGLVILGLLLILSPRLRQGWHGLEGGRALRWFVGGLAVVLAWSASAYAYNAWYDHAHLFDRAALVALAALVFWRPVFVLLFVPAYWAVIWQFDAPALGFYILIADFRPLVSVLIMFGAALLVQALAGGRHMTGFLFLTLCIVAANFWVPGYAKLRIGWITHGHVYLLLPNAYTHGWLAFLDSQTVSSMTALLAYADWPMRIGALCIECGSLFFLASARVAKVFLVLCSLLLGVFFLTLGYLFWKWVALHAVLWLLLFRSRESDALGWRRRLFTRERFAVSVLVIGGAAWWLAPAALAWFDTPLTSTLRYEAIGRSGALYEIPPGFFAPYESHIAMASFTGRLVPAPMLAMMYGVTGNKAMAGRLVRARTPADILELERDVAAGSPRLAVDEEFAREFDEFLRRAARASNQRLAAGGWGNTLAAWLRPPSFFWTFPHGAPYRFEEPIDALRVYWVSSFFDGRSHIIFRRELVRTVVVSPQLTP